MQRGDLVHYLTMPGPDDVYGRSGVLAETGRSIRTGEPVARIVPTAADLHTPGAGRWVPLSLVTAVTTAEGEPELELVLGE